MIKPTDYYRSARPDLLELIPREIHSVLDVGCGTGLLGGSINAKFGCRVTGIEIAESAAKEAQQHLDHVFVGSAEKVIDSIADERFDLLILGDVLEHMVDPEAFLRRVKRLIVPNGWFLISIPNAAHWSVVRMLVQGHWRYDPSGIMDATHLRWFTLESFTELLETSGYQIDHIKSMMEAGPGMPRQFLRVCRSLNLDMDAMDVESICYQYVLRGRVNADPRIAGLSWRTMVASLRREALAAQKRWDLKDGALKYMWRNYAPIFLRIWVQSLRNRFKQV